MKKLKVKKLEKNKWVQLCEKEEIICFLADRIPEAHSFERISSDKDIGTYLVHSLKRKRDGTYEVKVEKNEDWDKYYFRGMLDSIAEEWLNGELDWYYEYDKDYYGRDIKDKYRAILHFTFNAYLEDKYAKEYNDLYL